MGFGKYVDFAKWYSYHREGLWQSRLPGVVNVDSDVRQTKMIMSVKAFAGMTKFVDNSLMSAKARNLQIHLFTKRKSGPVSPYLPTRTTSYCHQLLEASRGGRGGKVHRAAGPLVTCRNPLLWCTRLGQKTARSGWPDLFGSIAGNSTSIGQWKKSPFQGSCWHSIWVINTENFKIQGVLATTSVHVYTLCKGVLVYWDCTNVQLQEETLVQF